MAVLLSPEVLMAVAVVFAGSLIQACTGFGLALVALAALLGLPPEQSTSVERESY